jgi:N-carbamoylputrescine amidase
VAVSDELSVALISEVFPGRDGGDRLRARLQEARQQGAELAVLPELPLDRWVPASDQPREEDAEPPDGPRQILLSAAAREVGIAVVGGAILQEVASGRRQATALLFDRTGRLAASYRKVHLPEEPGFWETSHYSAGDEMASPVEGDFPLSLGLQICSDINRPQGAHLLGALGAEAVLVPRATEQRTYARWRLVFQAVALTSALYVLSVNRPAPEDGVALGGPSIAVGPDGAVLLETTDALAVVRLARSTVNQARLDYPGYLPVRSRLYAQAWAAVTGKD